jgi:hypothetical protein
LTLLPAKHRWTNLGLYTFSLLRRCQAVYASQEDFLTAELARQYSPYVSDPKELKSYHAPHALNAQATRDRIAFWQRSLDSRRLRPMPSRKFLRFASRPSRKKTQGSLRLFADSESRGTRSGTSFARAIAHRQQTV